MGFPKAYIHPTSLLVYRQNTGFQQLPAIASDWLHHHNVWKGKKNNAKRQRPVEGTVQKRSTLAAFGWELETFTWSLKCPCRRFCCNTRMGAPKSTGGRNPMRPARDAARSRPLFLSQGVRPPCSQTTSTEAEQVKGATLHATLYHYTVDSSNLFQGCGVLLTLPVHSFLYLFLYFHAVVLALNRHGNTYIQEGKRK